MTELLKEAFEQAARLPAEQQDRLAQMLLVLAGKEIELPRFSAAQLRQIRASLTEADGCCFASDEAVDAAFAKYGA